MSMDTKALKDDGLWRAEDHDDEPRSHGNFGLDPCMQMMIAEAEALQRKTWKRELDLANEFMCEHRELRRNGGKYEPQTK
jgi:hypothetical protein